MVKRGICLKAQASTEILIVLAVAMAVFSAIFMYTQESASTVATEFEVTRAKTALDAIANGVEMVYQQGSGAKTMVYTNFPKNIKSASVTNQTISIVLYGPDGDISVFRSFNFLINGTINYPEGANWVSLQSFGTSVAIGNVSDLASVPAVCGNSLVEGIEQCDLSNLNGQTCTSQGYESGTLSCNSDCLSFNVSGCYTLSPGSISNLTNSSVWRTWIYWTWSNPSDVDFDSIILYLNGINIVNLSSPTNSYNATGLTSSTTYNLTIYTMDLAGNINTSHVSLAVNTLPPATAVTIVVYAQRCNAENNTAIGVLNQVCTGTYPAACPTDRLSCNDNSVEVHTANRVGGTYYYGGINISSYDSLITNCASITKVQLCHEWWAVTGLQNCAISVDANGAVSYTLVTSVCPDAVANPGVTCADVTANETWTCSNFFGASGTRAQAKSEAQRSGATGTTIISWDNFYFNVTYMEP